MVSSARYWRSKRASGTQGRVSLFFLPQNPFHVSAVQLCYKEALYMYLGHLPDFLKEKKKQQRKKNLSDGAPDLRNMKVVSGWAEPNAGRQIYNWARRMFIASLDDGMDISSYWYFPVLTPLSHVCLASLTLYVSTTLYIFCSFHWPKLKFLHGFLC